MSLLQTRCSSIDVHKSTANRLADTCLAHVAACREPQCKTADERFVTPDQHLQELCQAVLPAFFRSAFIMLAMTSTVVFCDRAERVMALSADLAGAGLTVLQSVAALTGVLAAVQQHQPDVLVCHVAQADNEFFAMTLALGTQAVCPVLVLTDSLDESAITAAAAAGVHCYVPDGYSAHRLPALVMLARCRFRHEAALSQALQVAQNQLEERKVVDHAKAILMRARDLPDDAAFRMLRTAAMHSNQRLAAVSGHVIHAARFADGVNRAGQLRMLSQRLVKLHALQLLQPGSSASPLMKESVTRIDDNLTVLAQNFAAVELALLIKQAASTWDALKRKLKRPPQVASMGLVNNLADTLLASAEQLTAQLENAGLAPPLEVLNLAGRQRMLTQRFAKLALLQALGMTGDEAAIQVARQSFEKAQHYLNNIPLNTPEIGQLLATAKLDWRRLLAGVEQVSTPAGRAEVESASEALLEVFEKLSATYETSMQMLLG